MRAPGSPGPGRQKLKNNNNTQKRPALILPTTSSAGIGSARLPLRLAGSERGSREKNPTGPTVGSAPRPAGRAVGPPPPARLRRVAASRSLAGRRPVNARAHIGTLAHNRAASRRASRPGADPSTVRGDKLCLWCPKGSPGFFSAPLLSLVQRCPLRSCLLLANCLLLGCPCARLFSHSLFTILTPLAASLLIPLNLRPFTARYSATDARTLYELDLSHLCCADPGPRCTGEREGEEERRSKRAKR